MKYIYFLIFSFLNVLSMYLILKSKERETTAYFNKIADIEKCREELTAVQKEFLIADINNAFSQYPYIQKYISNSICVLQKYGEIGKIEFKAYETDEYFTILSEYSCLCNEQKVLFDKATDASNKLCKAVNSKKYHSIVRKKKSELQKMAVTDEIEKFLRGLVKKRGNGGFPADRPNAAYVKEIKDKNSPVLITG